MQYDKLPPEEGAPRDYAPAAPVEYNQAPLTVDLPYDVTPGDPNAVATGVAPHYNSAPVMPQSYGGGHAGVASPPILSPPGSAPAVLPGAPLLPPFGAGGPVYVQPQSGYQSVPSHPGYQTVPSQPGYQTVPSQPGYQTMPPQPGYQTMVPQPVVMHEQYFGEGPVLTRCPACHNQTQTVTVGRTGTVTWVSCALICVFGGMLGCCFIPFCCRACQDTEHHCTHCGQPIALVKKC